MPHTPHHKATVPTTTELAAARNLTGQTPAEELIAAGVDPAIFDLGPVTPTVESGLIVGVSKGILDRSSNNSGERFRRVIDPNGPFAAHKNTTPPPLIPTRNSLNKFQSWTYKFSFYICKIEALIGDPRTSVKIIFAESGETNVFTMKNMEIKSVVAPGWRAKNFLINQFEFEIFEPRGGALFYEAILEAANLLSISNYINAPFYLELNWVGYDNDGVPLVIEDAEVRPKIWALKIVDIKSTLTAEGSVYRIKAIEFESWTSSNKWLVLDNHLAIEASTVGELFDGLKKEINKAEKQSGIWRMYPDRFDFKVDPEIRKIKLKESSATEGPQRQNSLLVFKQDRTIVEIPRGYDINEILNDLMVASEEWASVITDGDINSVNTGQQTTKKKAKRIWMLTSNVEIKEYDPAVNDYSKHITYNVSTYFTTRASIDPGQLNRTEEEIQANDKTLLQERSIGKIYEYIYTGQNTEVLNLEIDFNFMWTTNIPLYAGLQQVRSIDEGRVVSSKEQNAQEILALRYQALTNKFQNIEGVGGPGFETLEADLAELNQITRQLDRVRDQREESQAINNNILINISKDKEKLFASTVIEDLGRKDSAKPVPLPIPVPYTSDGSRPDTQSRGIMEGSHRPFRSIAASVLNQIFYTNAELMQIDLEIRGDPSWLGLSGVEQRLQGTLFTAIVEEDTLANRTGKEDILFVLEMKFSRFENSETGLLDFTDNEQQSETIVSGVYQAVELTSRFNEGVFTQVIHAIKDTKITRLRNLQKLKNKIK